MLAYSFTAEETPLFNAVLNTSKILSKGKALSKPRNIYS